MPKQHEMLTVLLLALADNDNTRCQCSGYTEGIIIRLILRCWH